MSANLRYAPEFRMAINGKPIPAALRASITSVNHQTGLEGADRVELTIANEDLRWLDHPLLALGNELALSLGYAPTTPKQIFVGEIVGQGANFPGSGAPELTITAQDREQRLQEGTKLRWFAIPVWCRDNRPLNDPTVVSIVSAENKLIPAMDPVSAALGVLLGGAQAMVKDQKEIRRQENVSDYEFLKLIAKENGWEMFIDHSGPAGGHKLRFQSPLSRIAPELTLRYGRSLVEFTPRISKVGQISYVTVYVWASKIKTSFEITVGWEWGEQGPTIEIRPAVSPMKRGRSYVIEKPLSLLMAPRAIFRELIPRLNQRLTGSGSTVGDPRIQAGMVLSLEGVGREFGGLYRVTGATHSLDSSGYRTSFEVRKEIWFQPPAIPKGSAKPWESRTPFGV